MKNAVEFEELCNKKFPIHYDPKKKVNKMLKQEVKPLKMGRMPALLVIDAKGIIRYAYYGDSMDDIPEDEEIIKILKEINN